MVAVWILLAVFVLLFVVVILKSQNFIYFCTVAWRYSLILAGIGLVVFVVFSSISLFKTNSLDLTSPSGVFGAVKVYFGWIKSLLGNVVDITGEAVHHEWFPNSTNSTN